MNCELHGQPILGYSEKDQLRKGLCSICMAEQINDFVFTEEANHKIVKFGRWFLEQFDTLNQNYTLQLKSLIQDINDIKTFINQSIDKLITNIQDWIGEATKQKSSHQTSLQDMKNLNFNGFVEQANKNWKDKEKQFKRIIFDLISKLLEKQWIQSSVKKLKEMQNIKLQIQLQEEIPRQQSNLDKKKYQTSLNLKCEQDDQQIIMMDINKNTPLNKRLACVDCITRDRSQYISIKEAQNLWNKQKITEETHLQLYLDQEEQKHTQTKQLFEQVTLDFNQTIEKVISTINEQNTTIISIINKQKYSIGLDWQTMPKGEIQKIAEILSNPKTEGEIKVEINNYCTKQQDVINKIINDSIINLQKSEQTNFNKILQLLKKDTQSTDLKQLQKERVEQNNQLKDVINYKQLDQYTIQQNEECRCLCFNQDQNILAVGCQYDIKIFKFENGKMTELQLLKGHTHYVYALYIGNNNQIYSCSADCTIKIWKYQSNKWIMHQSLQGHTNPVLCITLNKEEVQLITGSSDYTIKCWMKTQDQWKCVQTLQHHSHYVISLSLNESQNQLLSCGYDKKLNIFKCDSNKKWSLTQTITADDSVNRASFINENIIVYQLENKGILKVYEYNQTEFKQKQDIQVKGSGGCQWFFPQVYCKQQSILLSKNCQFINIIRIKKDNQFVVEQEIEYKSRNLYGTITNDGQFLVTWDQDSKQIQVRQLQ